MGRTMNSEQHRRLIRLRRELHQIPELGFEEKKTSDKICEVLEEIGIPYVRGLAGTGIVATLTRGSASRTIALRADIDALPITETSNLDYRSRHEGVMHACGHDGHTTMLLGAAQQLARSEIFDGTVHFVFQPAEEHGKGALKMIADGLFDRFPCHAIFGMHNLPWLETGKFATCAGPIMGAEDNFEIQISGRGGHAAVPHEAKDVLIIAASIICELQTIVSRSVDPIQGAVVSCTEIHTDGATNVLPTEAVIKGDTRSFMPEVSERIEQRMKAIVTGLCAAHEAEGSVTYTRLFLPTINTPSETMRAADVASTVAGPSNVASDYPPMMGAEDFGAMLHEVPGNYIFIGNKGPDGKGATMLHNASYDFNDDIIPLGVDYWVHLAETELPKAG